MVLGEESELRFKKMQLLELVSKLKKRDPKRSILTNEMRIIDLKLGQIKKTKAFINNNFNQQFRMRAKEDLTQDQYLSILNAAKRSFARQLVEQHGMSKSLALNDLEEIIGNG